MLVRSDAFAESVERKPSVGKRILKHLGHYAGLAVAVAPIAAIVSFQFSSVEKTLPIAGDRQFTFSPNLHGNVSVDAGPHGTLRYDPVDGPLGVDIKVGSVPKQTDAKLNDISVLTEAAKTLVSVNETTLTKTGEAIKGDLKNEMGKNFLLGELLLFSGLAGSELFRQQGRYGSLGIGVLALGLVAGYGTVAQYEEPKYWMTITTPVGDIQVDDTITAAGLREILPGAIRLNEKRIENNREYIDSVFELSKPYFNEILADMGEHDVLISEDSDMHTAEVMTEVAAKSNDYMHPDIALRSGDLSNADNVLEIATVVTGVDPESGTVTVAVGGNHDGKEIKDAMKEAGAIYPDGKLVTIENPRTGEPVTILGMDDPRVTYPGEDGVVPRSEGSVEKMQEALLEAARKFQPDIIMVHEPADIQYLLDNGITASFMVSGHTHVHSLEEIPDGEWLKAGDAGGIGNRDITNILTPFGRPGTEAYRYYIRYDSLNKRVAAIYIMVYTPGGKVSMDVFAPEYPPTPAEQANQIIRKNKQKLDAGDYKAGTKAEPSKKG